MVPYNVNAARVAGLELVASAPLASFLRFDASLTLQDPRDTTTTRATVNDILPFRSRLLATPRLTAGTPLESSVLRRIGGSASFTYQSSR